MNPKLRADAGIIYNDAIRAVLPDRAVERALQDLPKVKGRIVLVAAGKAAWQMAKAALCVLPSVDAGIVITKYDHVKGELPGVDCFEAGHPIPDQNAFDATKKAVDLVSSLTKDDLVLFLLSGGGSALFELPLIPGSELQEITQKLLACGADITKINTIRKRLSGVKGGRFAKLCEPAQVFSVVLSDIVGDPLDMIASGPAYPDSSTCDDALSIVREYALDLSGPVMDLLKKETPKELHNVTTKITGSVRELCEAALRSCKKLGYEPVLLTDHLDSEARIAGRDLGRLLAAVASERPLPKDSVFETEQISSPLTSKKLALIAGGETVVVLTGSGKGGRNQEVAVAAAKEIRGLPSCAVFSVGSDGTDGPTDAAGGYADGDTCDELLARGLDPDSILSDNDAYHALLAVDGLIITGPTGTNVNDISVGLLSQDFVHTS